MQSSSPPPTGTPTFELACALIEKRSLTPDDAGCQSLLIERLRAAGFRCDVHQFGAVTNLWAIRTGGASVRPIFAFAGHTDVVPTGPLTAWSSDPFIATVADGKLYGRGAADMKTSIAAFVVAAEEFIEHYPKHQGSIALLITSDEEGPGLDGTVRVCEVLERTGETPTYCVVGEPTSVTQVGDMIKNGRRGTLTGRLVVHGVQGHIAYPHLADNPIHAVAPVLAELVARQWDEGNEYYLPTSWQISNVHAGTGAGNVIPADITIDFNFRFSTASTVEGLQLAVQDVLARHGVRYDLQWTLGGMPFLTPKGPLSVALSAAILDETGLETELSTTGGTSDGRFIARICDQVIELGPPNASIHKIDEHVELAAIEPLKNIYRNTLFRLLAAAP